MLQILIKHCPAEPGYTLPLQCRSRSVGFFRSQLIWICTVCHSVCEFISRIWIKESDWLTIRSGHLNLFGMTRVNTNILFCGEIRKIFIWSLLLGWVCTNDTYSVCLMRTISIAADKRGYPHNTFTSRQKHYVVATHLKCLAEVWTANTCLTPTCLASK